MAFKRDLTFLCLGAVLLAAGWQASRVFGDTGRERSPRDVERGELARRAEESFARTFRRVAAFMRPSIVFVEVKHAPSASPGSGYSPGSTDELLPDETLRRFFMSPLRFEGQGEAIRVLTSGTGIIVDRDGTILTSAHVIASRADGERLEVPEIRVKLEDGRWFDAIVVGCAPRADLAVLRIRERPDDLVPAAMDDSDRAEPGDWVMALGNPFGREQTASLGIVSTKGRGGAELRFEDFLQTDAAINPGNTGGPLVDVTGTTVGINLGLAWTTTGGSTGIGFAIPSSSALTLRRRVDEIASVASDAFGLSVRELLPGELGGRRGLYVAGVSSGSVAAAARIHAGDALLDVDGRDLVECARARRGLSFQHWCDGRASSRELVATTSPAGRR